MIKYTIVKCPFCNNNCKEVKKGQLGCMQEV